LNLGKTMKQPTQEQLEYLNRSAPKGTAHLSTLGRALRALLDDYEARGKALNEIVRLNVNEYGAVSDLAIDGVVRKVLEPPAQIAEVGEIVVMNHSEKPCHHCGHKFEQAGNSCCDNALTHCPNCGCPATEPLGG
jgi:hypothetical protein